MVIQNRTSNNVKQQFIANNTDLNCATAERDYEALRKCLAEDEELPKVIQRTLRTLTSDTEV